MEGREEEQEVRENVDKGKEEGWRGWMKKVKRRKGGGKEEGGRI